MRNKMFKYVSVLVAVIIASSLFSITASAEVKETTYSNFWNLDTFNGKVWIMYTEDGGRLEDITKDCKFSFNSTGKIMSVDFYATENWGANNILYFNFPLDIRSQYTNPGVSSLKFTLYQWNSGRVVFSDTEPNENTGEVYAPWAYRDGYQTGGSKRDYQETYAEPNSAKNAITYEFSNQNAEYGFSRVVVLAYCTLKQSLSAGNYKVHFEFAGLDYRFSTMGEYLNMQIVENQNANTDKITANADKNADEIQANADKNASQIQQNQDKNTDKVLNGDTDLDSSGQTNQVNGTVGGIDEATNNALGGKSEAEIQAEVNGALDFNKIIGSLDFTKANRMSSFYDRCLTVFGSKYNSLLLLSLVLGLGAFLIGRRYG